MILRTHRLHALAVFGLSLSLVACQNFGMTGTSPTRTQDATTTRTAATTAPVFGTDTTVPPVELHTDGTGLKISVSWPSAAARTAQALPLSVGIIDIEVRIEGGQAAAIRLVRPTNGKAPAPVRVPLDPRADYTVIGKAYRTAPAFGEVPMPLAQATLEGVAVGRGQETAIRLDFKLTDPPVLTTLEGDGVLRPGQVVTLKGSGFGMTTGDKPIKVSFGGNVSTAVTVLAPDTIEVAVPPDLATTSGGTVSVVAALVDGIRSNLLEQPFAVKTGLAPDDAGLASAHHDYVVTVDGVDSTFVWVPAFRAWQVIRPLQAGLPSLPAGKWVKDQPPSGLANVDWAVESFGGFYVGKYEASRADAVAWDPVSNTLPTQGTGTSLKVARHCVPWGAVTWTEAEELSRTYHPNGHLLRDEEWTALAVWATIHGVSVEGDSADTSHASEDDPATTFEPGPNGNFAAGLTGSGRNASWTADQNTTAHTGTEAGVMDMVGNLDEWTEGIGIGPGGPGEAKWTYRGQISSVAAISGGTYIQTMSTEPLLRRLGLPATVAFDPPSTIWAGDYFYCGGANANGEAHARRGGWKGMGPRTGIWCTYVDKDILQRSTNYGFRPALSF